MRGRHVFIQVNIFITTKTIQSEIKQIYGGKNKLQIQDNYLINVLLIIFP